MFISLFILSILYINLSTEAVCDSHLSDNTFSRITAETEGKDGTVNKINFSSPTGPSTVKHVKVKIYSVSGEEIKILIYEKPLTPKKVYDELKKEKEFFCNHCQNYILIYESTPLDPMSEQELIIDNELRKLTLILRRFDMDQLIFINYYHNIGRYRLNSQFYDDYFLMFCAVQKNEGSALQHASDLIRHIREINLQAVKSNGMALQFVHEDLRDHEMFLAAVKSNCAAIQYVSDHLIDMEMLLTALKSNHSALSHISDQFIDYELCLNAVKLNGSALQHVPNNLIDPEICYEAVQKDGLALQFVPDTVKNFSICSVAVKNNSLAVKFLPTNSMYRSLRADAVKSNGLALDHVPMDLRDKKLCLDSVRQNGKALLLVPINNRDENICSAAVKQIGSVFHSVPQKPEYRDVCLAAVQSHSHLLQCVPDSLKDEVSRAADL